MKKIITKLCVISFLIIGLSGCFLKSVHPLITVDEGIILENLDGVYENEDQRWTFASDKNPDQIANLIRQYPDESLTFDPGEEDSLKMNAYLVMFENKQALDADPVLFIGTVGEINNELFLNLKILEITFGQNGTFIDAHRFNVNTFSKIEVNDENLVMEPFASSWIKDQIENNRVRIKHEVTYSDYDDTTEILITASTKELQKFVEKYGQEEDAYEDPITMKRMPDDVQ